MLLRTRNFIRDISLDRLFYILASLFFLASAIFSIYYFKERCLYIDSAYQLFKIVNQESFNIEAYRYGVVFTQILPLIAIKIGLSLKTVLIIYSLSFILISYIVFVFCYHILNEKTVSFILPSALIIGISHGYFYTVTEIYQALVYVVLFYAWINSRFKKKAPFNKTVFNISIAIIIFLLSFLCHPSSIFPILFIIAYHYIENNRGLKSEVLVLAPLVLIITVVKIYSINTVDYEGSVLNELINNPSLIFNLASLYPVQFFIANIFEIYLIPCILLAILTFNYLYKRKYLNLVFTLSSVFIFFTILSITFNMGDDDIVMEKTFALLFLLILIPLSKELVFNTQNNILLKVVAFSMIIIAGFYHVSQSGEYYKRRLMYIESLLEQGKSNQCDKYVAEKKDLDVIIRIPWAVSIESLFLSSMENPKHSKTIYVSQDKSELSTIKVEEINAFLMVPFYLEYGRPLNKKYFNLKSCNYSWLKPEKN